MIKIIQEKIFNSNFFVISKCLIRGSDTVNNIMNNESVCSMEGGNVIL